MDKENHQQRSCDGAVHLLLPAMIQPSAERPSVRRTQSRELSSGERESARF